MIVLRRHGDALLFIGLWFFHYVFLHVWEGEMVHEMCVKADFVEPI